MTVIRPNSVSGITSITAQANEINFFRSNGTLAGLQLNGVNFNTTTGVSTFNNLDVGGVLTYQDVTNVDSIGIITARSTIDAQGDVSIADKIIHTGDTNCAIRFPANDTISFETSGTEKFRIQPNGRVGIGTDNPPDCTLTVCEFNSGTEIYDNIALRLQGSSGQNVAVQFTDTTGAAAYIAVQGDALRLGTNNTERLRIDSSGRVLIGETSVSGSTQKLVIGNGGNENFEFSPAMTSNDLNGGLIEYLHRNDGNTRPDLNLYTGGSGAIKFYTNGNQRFRITSGGCFYGDNIGIGTDNRWKIRPNSNNTQLAFEYSTSTSLSDTNIKMALLSDSVDVLSDFAIKSSLAKMSMIDTDGGDYFQLRNDGGSFKIRNSSDGRDDIDITNNLLTLGGVLKIQDNNSIFFGSSQDIEIRHNASTSRNEIIGKNHNLRIQSNGTLELQCFQSTNSNNGNVLTATYNGGTKLYYQNGERLVTQNGGCKISNNLNLTNWLHIGKSGGYTANASVGHNNTILEGIFWHSGPNYSIARSIYNWSNPYAQLNLDWPTGIKIDGGASYGLSGARFNCHTMPTTNNTYDLGTSSLRWRDVYCNQGAFNNSDIELKQDIASLTAAEMKAAKRLSALFKTYRWKDAVEEKGTDKARTHTGMIAQQIQAAMSAEGLDATKYGLFGTDEWYENDKKEIITLDQLKDDIPDPLDSSKTINPMSTEGYTKITRYSVRYTELLSFIAAYNDQRFADLESRVAALEGS